MSLHNTSSSANQPIWVEVPEFLWDGSDVATYPVVLQRGATVDPIRLLAQPDTNGHITDPTTVLFDLVAGSLPPGLELKKVGQYWYLQGTVGILPKGVTRYQAVIRITPRPEDTSSTLEIAEEQLAERTFEFRVYPANEGHSWDPNWLSGLTTEVLTTGQTVYTLGSLTRGQATNLQLVLLNPDSDKLTFTVVTAGPDFEPKPSFMPTGLVIDRLYRVVGVPNSTNPEGDYYFKIRVSDGENSGVPATDSDDFVFKFSIDGGVTVDPQPTDEVDWETNSFLGSTYENFPSHFVVKASNPAGLSVRYELAPTSKPLPLGITLEAESGMIVGIFPFIGATTTYTITIRAFIGNSYQDKDFTFTVINLYRADGIMKVWATVNELARSKIAKWMYAVNLIGESKYFRYTDPNFGRIKTPKMYMIDGLQPSVNLMDHLRDYHRTMFLRFGELATAKAYDPSGAYVYDIIYFKIQDPNEKAGGFNGFGREQFVPRPAGGTTEIPTWNLVGQANDGRFHPNSILNARQDLIQQISVEEPSRRIDWPDGGADPSLPGYEPWMGQQKATLRGVGLSGKEGMPLWMTCRQKPNDPLSVLGFQPAVELAYVKPGLGPSILNILRNGGFEKEFNGLDFTVDRYLLSSIGTLTTTFDNTLIYDFDLQYTATAGQTTWTIPQVINEKISRVQLNYQDVLGSDWSISGDAFTLANPANDGDFLVITSSTSGQETTFDGPLLTVDPTDEYTTFDLISLPVTGKYYKFPPGDRKAG